MYPDIHLTLCLNYHFIFIYHPFHKTLPRSRASVNWTSVWSYEIDCTYIIIDTIKMEPVQEEVWDPGSHSRTVKTEQEHQINYKILK